MSLRLFVVKDDEEIAQIENLCSNFTITRRTTEGVAGYEFSTNAVEQAKGKAFAKIGLAILAPEGFCGRVPLRSELALKEFISFDACAIDVKI